MMMRMDAKMVLEATGLTYGRLNYLIEQVDALKREKTQGKARDFYFRDLVYLKLASLMRTDGIRISAINDAIELLGNNWRDDDNIDQAGTLIREHGKGGEVIWHWGIFDGIKIPGRTTIDGDEKIIKANYGYVPGSVYSVKRIAIELKRLLWLAKAMSETEAVNH